MSTIRKLPIGVQSFEKLISNGFLYVDKTAYVWKLAQVPAAYFLNRPRRFGKSLFLSTLAAYFRGQRELFKGLAIEQLEEKEKEYRAIWQEYPVLYLDFNAKNYSDAQALYDVLNAHLREWETAFMIERQEESPDGRFSYLLKTLYEKTGKQAVILIDEYDKPLLQTMWKNKALNEIYRGILKGFYGVLKSCDQYIHFSFLTGATKFSKISIFSDLNNLRDISLEENYAGICGVSEAELKEHFQIEIQALAKKQKLSYNQMLTALKQHYDGYRFHPEKESMYNPFSLLNALAKRELGSYWFATGTPTFLIEYLRKAHYNIPDLDGGVHMNKAGLETYRAETVNPLPILFQAGYLTIKDYNKFSKLYRLGFPNDEVCYGFLDSLLPSYTPVKSYQTGLAIWELYEQLEKGDVDGFMEKMKGIISGIPYDTVVEKNITLQEQNYQTAVYLIFALMNQFVHTEVQCFRSAATEGGNSRQHQHYTRTYNVGVDCIVEMQNKVYLFEFKAAANGTVEDALKQIQEKGYADRYAESEKKVIAIGSSFDEEKRTIKEWIVSHNG